MQTCLWQRSILITTLLVMANDPLVLVQGVRDRSQDRDVATWIRDLDSLNRDSWSAALFGLSQRVQEDPRLNVPATVVGPLVRLSRRGLGEPLREDVTVILRRVGPPHTMKAVALLLSWIDRSRRSDRDVQDDIRAILAALGGPVMPTLIRAATPAGLRDIGWSLASQEEVLFFFGDRVYCRMGAPALGALGRALSSDPWTAAVAAYGLGAFGQRAQQFRPAIQRLARSLPEKDQQDLAARGLADMDESGCDGVTGSAYDALEERVPVVLPLSRPTRWNEVRFSEPVRWVTGHVHVTDVATGEELPVDLQDDAPLDLSYRGPFRPLVDAGTPVVAVQVQAPVKLGRRYRLWIDDRFVRDLDKTPKGLQSFERIIEEPTR